MGYYCTVPQCTSLAGKTKNVKFHRFPRDETMADKWNLILKRGKPYTKYSKVCSLHFTQADYNVTTMGQWKTLSKDAVPSQNLPKLNADGSVMVIRKSRTVKYRDIKKEDIQSDKVMGRASASLDPSEQHGGCCEQQRGATRCERRVSPAVATRARPAAPDRGPQQAGRDHADGARAGRAARARLQRRRRGPPAYTHELDAPHDYTKTDEDFMPQTNEEYNKQAEKYALERKARNGFERPEPAYRKPPDVYGLDKFQSYQGGFQDGADALRHQQHNLQALQDHHRITDDQNFFNENHIKQEIDMAAEDDKFMYERSKDQLEASSLYEGQRRLMHQQRLLEQLQHQVKQEPDASAGAVAPPRDAPLPPQGSPYYAPDSHANATGAYYEPLPRPGAELLIAKQNALAAHTQLWQNTMKRPFFYSESPHYNGPQLLHRYEDITRILQ
ncbi:LOW QUALITY PROTEIN: uncharacterized protein ACR2FA_010769 [Aphomia sociella]